MRMHVIHWVGTIAAGVFGNWDVLYPFVAAARNEGIRFEHHTDVDVDSNIRLIQESYMAPAIVGGYQEEIGYIPCRIFKNISYGQMGITNSYRVYELFEKKIVYNPNTYQLFYDAKARLNRLTHEELFELMDLVKEKHTYLNRINTLLEFLELVKQSVQKSGEAQADSF